MPRRREGSRGSSSRSINISQEPCALTPQLCATALRHANTSLAILDSCPNSKGDRLHAGPADGSEQMRRNDDAMEAHMTSAWHQYGRGAQRTPGAQAAASLTRTQCTNLPIHGTRGQPQEERLRDGSGVPTWGLQVGTLAFSLVTCVDNTSMCGRLVPKTVAPLSR